MVEASSNSAFVEVSVTKAFSKDVSIAVETLKSSFAIDLAESEDDEEKGAKEKFLVLKGFVVRRKTIVV